MIELLQCRLLFFCKNLAVWSFEGGEKTASPATDNGLELCLKSVLTVQYLEKHMPLAPTCRDTMCPLSGGCCIAMQVKTCGSPSSARKKNSSGLSFEQLTKYGNLKSIARSSRNKGELLLTCNNWSFSQIIFSSFFLCAIVNKIVCHAC